MTNKEAIKIFQEVTVLGEDVREAVYMAIRALKQESCDDAISRKDAIDCVSAISMCDPIIAQTKLKRLPKVFVKPRTGHWVYNSETDLANCSECGCKCAYDNLGRIETPFCPNCGAKMESED